MDKKVSVIIPTYNHAHLITLCLESLIKQTYKNWEAIVVNNFSKDNTIQIVESFQDKRIKLINFNNNGIIAAARNEGIRNADGEFIAFLDSDDYWYPQKLEICLEKLEDCDVVYHNLREFGPKGTSWRVNKGRRMKSPVFEDLMTLGNQIQNSSAMVRKKLVDEAGGLSEDPMLFALEDFDLWLRIAKKTEKFIFIDQTLGGYWVDSEKSSSPSLKNKDRINHLYQKHLPSVSSKNQKAAKALLKYLELRERMLSGDKELGVEFFKNIVPLRRLRFKVNSLVFFFMGS